MGPIELEYSLVHEPFAFLFAECTPIELTAPRQVGFIDFCNQETRTSGEFADGTGSTVIDGKSTVCSKQVPES